MSYDIDLIDPVSKEVLQLPVNHVMIGGTYAADYDEQTGLFTPKPISDAHLNITYNYAVYYYEAADGDPRFFGQLPDDNEDDKPRNLGIRGIYGKTGAESLKMLSDMIYRIECKYKKDGEWITTERDETRYRDAGTGLEIDISEVLHRLLHDEDKPYTEEKYTEQVNEGVNSDYWKATAGNAIRPLYKLIAMAQLRPDGVWNGD